MDIETARAELERAGKAQRDRERDDHLKATIIARDGRAESPRDQCATEANAVRTIPGAAGLTLANVEDCFTYQPWDGWQAEAGAIVKESLVAAAKAIIRVVPEGPSRTIALNHLIDARMRANQSITFRGRF